MKILFRSRWIWISSIGQRKSDWRSVCNEITDKADKESKETRNKRTNGTKDIVDSIRIWAMDRETVLFISR